MVVSVAYLPKLCIHIYYYGVIFIKKIKDQSQNEQNRRYGEMEIYIFETYNNSVIPHILHIYQTASEMVTTKICTYPPYQHALPHWKYVLRYCEKFPHIDIPSQ